SQNSKGRTALHIAVNNGSIEILKYLLAQDSVDSNSVDDKGNTALHLAAQYGHTPMGPKLAKIILSVEGIQCDNRDEYGQTPFLVACFSGSLEVVRNLFSIAPSLDRHAVDFKGQCALHHAAKSMTDSADLVQFLLEELKFDCNEATPDGVTPLMFAVSSSNKNIVGYLLSVTELDFRAVDREGKTAM
ncbi:ankyrin, partial [Ascobolus immersus RN42]